MVLHNHLATDLHRTPNAHTLGRGKTVSSHGHVSLSQRVIMTWVRNFQRTFELLVGEIVRSLFVVSSSD